MRRKRALSLLLVSALGCGDSTRIPEEEGVFCQVERDLLARPSREVDLLLVVDTTESMAALRDRWNTNLARFAAVLENLDRGLPSLHLAVTAADGTGVLRSEPTQTGCTAPDGTFLVDEALAWWICSDEYGARCGEKNYSASLALAIQCMGTLVADRVEPAPSFESMKKVLEGTSATSSGFLRPYALLSVVFVTDGDDGSDEPVATYAELLHSLDERPGRVLVSAVAPPSSPRIEALLAEFPFGSIAVSPELDDWSNALLPLAESLQWIDDPNCLFDVAPVDLEPETPGAQLECAAAYVDLETGLETALPRCAMLAPERPHPDTTLPCWWVRDGQDYGCPFVAHLERELPPPTGARPQIRCAGTCGE